MKKMKVLADILTLTDPDLKHNIPKGFRFLFCAFFTFLAYVIFRMLGQLSPKEMDLILVNILDPSWFILGLLAFTFSCFGLWSSLIAVSFFNSLVPKI